MNVSLFHIFYYPSHSYVYNVRDVALVTCCSKLQWRLSTARCTTGYPWRTVRSCSDVSNACRMYYVITHGVTRISWKKLCDIVMNMIMHNFISALRYSHIYIPAVFVWLLSHGFLSFLRSLSEEGAKDSVMTYWMESFHQQLNRLTVTR